MTGTSATTCPPDADAAVEQYGMWVKREALSVRGRMPWADLDELIQCGVVALLESREHFDEALGSSFKGYAAARVRGAMIDSLRRDGSAVRRLERNPTKALEWSTGSTSISTDPLETLSRIDQSDASRKALACALATLPERDQTLLQLRYVEGLGNNEVAEVFSITPSRASRLHRNALDRLRETMERMREADVKGATT